MRIPMQLVAVALAAFGVTAVRNPRRSATQYGLPTKDRSGLGFVRAVGARDVAIAALLLTSRGGKAPLAIVALLGLSDFFTVSSTSEEPPLDSLRLHALGFAGALLLALRARD